MLPPPQDDTPQAPAISRATKLRAVRNLRRFALKPNSSTQARTVPPRAYQFGFCGIEFVAVHAPCCEAVVVIVKVAVPALAPVMFTGVVAPKLIVGRFAAPVGLDVRAAVSETLPVNPFTGVMEIVEVLPVLAPAEIVTAEPLIVNPGISTAVTVTLLVPDAEL